MTCKVSELMQALRVCFFLLHCWRTGLIDLMHVGFDLVTTWSEKVVESSLEMAEMENASLHEAEKWILTPNLSPNL